MIGLIVLLVVGAAAGGGFIALRVRASQREAARIAAAMAALDAPPPPPPDELLALGLGAPSRWGVVTDEGHVLSLHPATLVMVKGTEVTLRVPLAEMTAISAPRSMNPIKRNRRGREVYDAEIAGDDFELRVTWAEPEKTDRVLVFQIDDARDWADAISAACRAARA